MKIFMQDLCQGIFCLFKIKKLRIGSQCASATIGFPVHPLGG